MTALGFLSPDTLSFLIILAALGVFAFIWYRATVDFDTRLSSNSEVVLPSEAISTWNARVRLWGVILLIIAVAAYIFREDIADALGLGGP